MELCANHPVQQAVEQCEVGGKWLCPICLWYSEDGRRLCEAHAIEEQAAGLKVYPPETYADAVANTMLAAEVGNITKDKSYRGNKHDLYALLAAAIALTTLFSCAGGVYCLPLVALPLGIAAYANAPSAHDPGRTRRLAMMGIGVSTFIGLCIFIYFGGIIAFGVLAAIGGG